MIQAADAFGAADCHGFSWPRLTTDVRGMDCRESVVIHGQNQEGIGGDPWQIKTRSVVIRGDIKTGIGGDPWPTRKSAVISGHSSA